MSPQERYNEFARKHPDGVVCVLGRVENLPVQPGWAAAVEDRYVIDFRDKCGGCGTQCDAAVLEAITNEAVREHHVAMRKLNGG